MCTFFAKTFLEIAVYTWADPGFFLGGGALVSCSTSTPINHIVFFFCRIPVVLENRRSSQGGVRTPCTLPLDPPLDRGGSRIFLGGDALVSCSTSTPINHIVFFFLQNTSCIRKPQVISGGVRTPCTLPLDPPLIHQATWPHFSKQRHQLEARVLLFFFFFFYKTLICLLKKKEKLLPSPGIFNLGVSNFSVQ